jgi:biopolymer transport protein TolQ
VPGIFAKEEAMGSYGIPIFLQVAESFSQLITNAGALAKSILAVLLVLSVVSWTIMVEKFRFFRRSAAQSKRFLERFEKERSLEQLAAAAESLPLSPEGQVATTVTEEIAAGELESMASLDTVLESESSTIISEWESYLIFLATTATISPFLGLLGTVWGIMSSFLSMGLRGSANLYVVGPGIAEALITTIFGLGAAIPAVIGYNYIVRVIRRREDTLSAFAARFRNRLLEKRYVELERGSSGRTDREDVVAKTV